MRSDLKSFLRHVVERTSCGYVDIRAEETEQTVIAFRGPELDGVGRTFEQGGCLRVFLHGNWLSASFNRIDDSLHDLCADLCAQAERLPPRDEELPSLPALDESVAANPADDPRQVPLERKHALIERYNNILLSNKAVTTTVSVYGDVHKRVCFFSTDNRCIDQETVYTGFACNAVARDGTNIQSYGDSFGKTQGFASLQNLEPDVERIAGVAVELLRAEPVPAGKYMVVIDPQLGGVFAHEAFGHLSEADFLYGNERLRELMRVGTRYGVEELSIVDDATLPGERGSYRYDSEGTAAGRTELIREGCIAGHLHDRHSAARMRESLTGNARAISYRFPPIVRMSNTFIEPRSGRLDAMLDSMENGLYVVGSRGGMTELETFTFSSEYAWLIERGRKTRMVRDVTLSGNIFDTLRNIDMIGDDLRLFGGLGGCGKNEQMPLPVGLGSPHVRIKNVVVGGR